MLCDCCSTNEEFQLIPNTTNAVESHNRVSKGSRPDILKVALMATYKIDMVSTLEHLANKQGVQTSYYDLSVTARAQRTKSANKARSRKRARNDDNAEGPPDKHDNFKKGMCRNVFTYYYMYGYYRYGCVSAKHTLCLLTYMYMFTAKTTSADKDKHGKPKQRGNR